LEEKKCEDSDRPRGVNRVIAKSLKPESNVNVENTDDTQWYFNEVGSQLCLGPRLELFNSRIQCFTLFY